MSNYTGPKQPKSPSIDVGIADIARAAGDEALPAPADELVRVLREENAKLHGWYNEAEQRTAASDREIARLNETYSRQWEAQNAVIAEYDAKLRASRAEADAMREELRGLALEETAWEGDSSSYRCLCCNFEWVDRPERHDEGCLAAPKGAMNGERND